ncbi:hypothetical protein KNP414_00319 [Paenibacillus mucilaginosus KNP414]|uniref:Uncharacterized protein n=1 Tax=Paenibacillus mucilaginosus (strain KNP414) TaxID=1036673 RepID=F8FNA7_PAEMK|nr:hypothetical protein KNP414_00319 [Paenibacillus mucilaginosus KNP414]
MPREPVLSKSVPFLRGVAEQQIWEYPLEIEGGIWRMMSNKKYDYY